MNQPKIILIAGPTASGKSALALNIARRENGTIINADAMQVYAGLPILTAQPSDTERKQIPHRLYAVFDPAERSSAGKWQRLAVETVSAVLAEGRTPVVTGGTGLYFRALFDGLADIPDIPEEARAKAQKLYQDIGEDRFRKELAQLDPESAARIARNDRQRLIRAYEVAAHTGKPLGEWQQANPTKPRWQASYETHLLLPPRDILYAACDHRLLSMIRHGAVDEVRDLLKRDLDPELPALKTLGLREIAAHLKGELTIEQAIAKAQQATRNYAKRQMTWFRNQWKSLPII